VFQTLADEYREEIQRMSQELAEYRAYIHDLERRLGLPLSGEPQADESRVPTQ
jgi:hypothetical protein